MRELIEIFLTSARVGAMTFGGGYAMLPILQREVVEKKQWNTQEEILDYYALSQCLPGIIMVNTLVFVGKKRKGIGGAWASALGAVTPSFVIITVIAALLTAFAEVPAVQSAFAGIRVCVCVLIFNSILKLWKSSVGDKKCLLLFLAVALGSLAFDITPIAFVLAAAVIGILLNCMGKRHEQAGERGEDAGRACTSERSEDVGQACTPEKSEDAGQAFTSEKSGEKRGKAK